MVFLKLQALEKCLSIHMLGQRTVLEERYILLRFYVMVFTWGLFSFVDAFLFMSTEVSSVKSLLFSSL